MFYFPISYHKQMDRVNLMQVAVNAYCKSLLDKLKLTYPLL